MCPDSDGDELKVGDCVVFTVFPHIDKKGVICEIDLSNSRPYYVCFENLGGISRRRSRRGEFDQVDCKPGWPVTLRKCQDLMT